MTTKTEAALAALQAMLEAAFPGGSVFRDPEKPPTETQDGIVLMESGDPGEPTITISPVHFQWEHMVPLELLAVGTDRNSVVDGMQSTLDVALAADRSLGGVVIDARVMTAAILTEIGQGEGAQAIRLAQVAVRLEYDSSSPLG